MTTPPPIPECVVLYEDDDVTVGGYTTEQIKARDAQWMERITALEAEIAALKPDAQRYRWLRSEHERVDPVCHLTWKLGMRRGSHEWVNTANLDASIDAARAALENTRD